MKRTIRIATYNVHKCRGLDRREHPERIAAVLRELAADVIALQEVLSIESARPRDDQVRYLQQKLGDYDFCLGENRRLRGGAYGNAILSRLPLLAWENHNISWAHRERRGALRADLDLGGGHVLHLFNVHMGTAFLERRHQARRLMSRSILRAPDLVGPRVVVGDFNEWTRGLTTRLLSRYFESVDLAHHLRRRRTYPGVLPLMHLDHVYFDPQLTLESFRLHRSRAALIASDHLPLVAEFRVGEDDSSKGAAG